MSVRIEVSKGTGYFVSGDREGASLGIETQNKTFLLISDMDYY